MSPVPLLVGLSLVILGSELGSGSYGVGAFVLQPPTLAFPAFPGFSPRKFSSSVRSFSSSSSDSALGVFEQHAREVFLTYATDCVINESDPTSVGETMIDEPGLGDMLRSLDIDASPEETGALFKYLDGNEDGRVFMAEFLPWYSEAVNEARDSAQVFQGIIMSRRTVDRFDQTKVDDAVLRRALECAIAAPNRQNTEPWRFIKLGPETVQKVAALKESLKLSKNAAGASWTEVPGWCVVTYKKSDDEALQREDLKSVYCAVQNFMLSMWSEGIGTKWTDGPVQRTPEFAEICGVDQESEGVAGVIWYGFAKGGLGRAQPKLREKGVDEVLDVLP